MSVEQTNAVVRRWSEALHKRNLALLDNLVAPDYVDHTEKPRGLEELKQHYTTLFKGFPDLHVTTEDIIAKGDTVWVAKHLFVFSRGLQVLSFQLNL